jgi:hypothetical protein
MADTIDVKRIKIGDVDKNIEPWYFAFHFSKPSPENKHVCRDISIIVDSEFVRPRAYDVSRIDDEAHPVMIRGTAHNKPALIVYDKLNDRWLTGHLFENGLQADEKSLDMNALLTQSPDVAVRIGEILTEKGYSLRKASSLGRLQNRY